MENIKNLFLELNSKKNDIKVYSHRIIYKSNSKSLEIT